MLAAMVIAAFFIFYEHSDLFIPHMHPVCTLFLGMKLDMVRLSKNISIQRSFYATFDIGFDTTICYLDKDR